MRHVISIAQAVRHPCCTLHPVVLPVTLVSCPPTPHPLCLPHRHLHPFIHPFSDHPESGRRHQRRRPKNYEGLQPGNARRAVPVRLRQRSLLRRCSCWHAAGSAEQRRSAGGLRGRQRQRPASTGASTGPAGGAAEVEPGRVGGPPAAPAPGQGPGAAVQQLGGAAAAEQRAAAVRSGRRVGQPALLRSGCSGWVGGCSGWAGTGVGGCGGWGLGWVGDRALEHGWEGQRASEHMCQCCLPASLCRRSSQKCQLWRHCRRLQLPQRLQRSPRPPAARRRRRLPRLLPPAKPVRPTGCLPALVWATCSPPSWQCIRRCTRG